MVEYSLTKESLKMIITKRVSTAFHLSAMALIKTTLKKEQKNISVKAFLATEQRIPGIGNKRSLFRWIDLLLSLLSATIKIISLPQSSSEISSREALQRFQSAILRRSRLVGRPC